MMTRLIKCALVIICCGSVSDLTLIADSYEPAWDPIQWPRLGVVLTEITGDEAGTIYVGGRYSDGPGFVAAFDANGRQSWIRSIYSGSGLDHVTGLEIDSAGNIFVAGETYRFGSEAFVAKFNSQGQRLWERHTSSPDNEFGHDVAVDSFGNVYLAGSTTGQVGDVSYGGYDAFVSKYDSDGNSQWTKQYDSDVGGTAIAISIDNNDDLLLAGRRGGTIGTTLSKLTPDGNIIWNKDTNYSVISGRGTQTTALATDDKGNSYTVGAMDMLLGNNARILESDAVVAKHDTDGNLVWQRQIPGAPANLALGIDLGSNGNVYISGITNNTVYGEVKHLVDGFLAGYSEEGNPLWYQEFGTQYSDFPIDVHLDNYDRLFIAGFHRDYGGPEDAGFIARFDPIPEPAAVMHLYSLVACGLLAYLRRRNGTSAKGLSRRCSTLL